MKKLLRQILDSVQTIEDRIVELADRKRAAEGPPAKDDPTAAKGDLRLTEFAPTRKAMEKAFLDGYGKCTTRNREKVREICKKYRVDYPDDVSVLEQVFERVAAALFDAGLSAGEAVGRAKIIAENLPPEEETE